MIIIITKEFENEDFCFPYSPHPTGYAQWVKIMVHLCLWLDHKAEEQN